MAEIIEARTAATRILIALEGESLAGALDALMEVAVFLVRESEEPNILAGHLMLCLAGNLLEGKSDAG